MGGEGGYTIQYKSQLFKKNQPRRLRGFKPFLGGGSGGWDWREEEGDKIRKRLTLSGAVRERKGGGRGKVF